MTYRALQVIAGGQWCGPLLQDDTFPDDGRAWADAVADTLGLVAGSLRVVDGDSDPRTGALLADTNTTQVEQLVPSKLDQVLDILASSKALDAADKAAIEALRG